ncbi:MAG: porin family protein [Alphaproteobacteria bacterium]|nr:porin family protein [Alphaproteobacteria bacterium]
MEFKRALLASSALALFAGAQEAQAGGLYLSVFGGANFQPDSSTSFFTGKLSQTFTASSTIFEPDTGFVLGGAVGTSLDKWAKGLRVEAEVSYRRNDVGGAWGFRSGGEGGEGAGLGIVDSNTSNFAILANLWYDIDIGNKVRPYVGGGVGWARARRDGAIQATVDTDLGGEGGTFTTSALYQQERNGFAWQLGAGFNYEVSPGVDVGLGYRFFKGPKLPAFLASGGESGGEFGIPTEDNENHAVQANITIKIDP